MFILCAEILSVRIRNNKNIKGIKIDNTEIKFSQYADDASAFLDGSKQSLEEILQELETFADISGLKTNFDKTQVVWIGAKKYSTDSIKTRWKLSWGTTQFKLLGVIFNVDLDKIVDINYKDKIAQVKNLIKIWQRRFLTPLGKVTVIKTLILPKITHLLIALPNPNYDFLKNINSIFYDYLWNGRAKIKQTIVIKQYLEGGLKMINLKAFSQALKITWNELYNIDDKAWENIFDAPFRITKCTKLRWFQTTINHKIMVTNNFLFKINLINNPNCSFCGNSEETIEHLLWKCPQTQIFIKEMIKQFKEMSIDLNLTEETFILGNFSKSTSETVQFLLLIAKYFISMCRNTNKPLMFLVYKINVRSLYLSHKEIALKNNKMPEFMQSWRPFEKLLDIG